MHLQGARLAQAGLELPSQGLDLGVQAAERHGVGRPRRPGTTPKGARLVAERTSALIDWFFRCR